MICDPLVLCKQKHAISGFLGEFALSVSGDCISAWWTGAAGWPMQSGNVALNRMNGGEWWVAHVIIRPDEMRGKGVGSKLMEMALGAVKELGATEVIVAPSGYGEDLKQQENFYRKCGFVTSLKRDYGLEGLVREWGPV